jgi:hypothetical protein
MPFAKRDLTTNDGRAVNVEIYAPEPEPMEPNREWRCRFHLTGAVEKDTYGRSIDSLDSGLVLSWVGGEPGDHGVPRFVPQFLGRAFAKDIEDEIDRRIVARIAAIKPPGAP